MLGNALKALRESAGLTHRELALAMGVTRSYVTQIENNFTIPTPERLQQLAKLLDADVDHLTLLAGRVPADVVEALRVDPTLLITIRQSR
jgi:transcriptional regulator with XRE-family HTH domain